MGPSFTGKEIERKFIGDLDIPPELEESLQRHREHLARLVTSLRSAGVDEFQVETSVSMVSASHKDELTRTIKRMAR